MNKIKQDLIKLGLETDKSIKKFYPRTRDRKDIKVLKCDNTEALILDSTDHITKEYYKNKENYFNDDIINELDTRRRAEIIKNYDYKKWLDIGTGQGKILEQFEVKADFIEPQSPKGYNDISEVKKKYNLITMFHVLEHIPTQIDYLKSIYKILNKDGYLIIEVPHAKDILIETCEAFRKHTFWSEHLILHTDKTLLAFLEAAGFNEIQIIPEQRYNLANHIYWQKYGKPGGHNHLTCDIISENKSRKHLIKSRNHDTLIAIVKKP